MYIIRDKRANNRNPGWVVMKTPLGPMFVAFADEQDAITYLSAIGAASHLEPHSQESLLNSDPKALDGVTQLLLFPSLEDVRSLLSDANSFPYERFVVPMARARKS